MLPHDCMPHSDVQHVDYVAAAQFGLVQDGLGSTSGAKLPDHNSENLGSPVSNPDHNSENLGSPLSYPDHNSENLGG